MDMQSLSWLHGQPLSSGRIKSNPEDFMVIEDLGFRPDGEGEHLLLNIRKIGCNTRFVADALAKYLGVHAREVSFAGQKDRHAVTEQWFCVRLPGKEMPNLQAFTLEGCQILEVARHRRKLRLGVLKGNSFSLILREISHRDALEQRLQRVAQDGVPNYFGQQRFGINGNNLAQAQRWAASRAPVRDRNKRSFWLSAARSALFNQLVDARIKDQSFNLVRDGDVLQLAGRGSWFVASEDEREELQARVDSQELLITAAMPGDGSWGTERQALDFETQCLADQPLLVDLLVRERVEAARRAMRLRPLNMKWNFWDDVTLELQFWLPAGSFATSVARELINSPDDLQDIAE